VGALLAIFANLATIVWYGSQTSGDSKSKDPMANYNACVAQLINTGMDKDKAAAECSGKPQNSMLQDLLPILIVFGGVAITAPMIVKRMKK